MCGLVRFFARGLGLRPPFPSCTRDEKITTNAPRTLRLGFAGGGSIPVAALFDSTLHAPSVMLGFGLPDDNVHAPNEKFHLPYYYAAIRSCIRFLTALGA